MGNALPIGLLVLANTSFDAAYYDSNALIDHMINVSLTTYYDGMGHVVQTSSSPLSLKTSIVIPKTVPDVI